MNEKYENFIFKHQCIDVTLNLCVKAMQAWDLKRCNFPAFAVSQCDAEKQSADCMLLFCSSYFLWDKCYDGHQQKHQQVGAQSVF